jgi:enamine deaminase RidA (YjgF/YER057c/UK114 family)
MFVTDMAFSYDLSEVHSEVFRDIRPAATMVAVAGLMHPSLLVEIEVDAHRAPAR